MEDVHDLACRLYDKIYAKDEEIESLRQQLSGCQKSLNAAKIIIESKESRQLSEAVVAEARSSLDSERIANEALTEEIESLREQLAECEQYKKETHFAHWKELYQTQLGAAQAREAKLREAIANVYGILVNVDTPVSEYTKRILLEPSDDTALKETIQQAKREALASVGHLMHTKDDCDELRRMAKELK
jgi:chromosome segregation ATPase